jgi:putative AlgH/UPF0301 family transcriptional regulator
VDIEDCDVMPICDIGVHTFGRPLQAKIRDFDSFTTLEIVVCGGPVQLDHRIVLFTNLRDDAQLEAVVNGILEARPELREKLVREDTGPEEMVDDGQA